MTLSRHDCHFGFSVLSLSFYVESSLNSRERERERDFSERESLSERERRRNCCEEEGMLFFAAIKILREWIGISDTESKI